MFTDAFAELIPLGGLVTAIALFRWRPAITGISIAGAVLAAAVGEVVMWMTAPEAQKPGTLFAAIISLPVAVLSVGGWAAVLAGAAVLGIERMGLRVRLPRVALFFACVIAGGCVGFVFCSIMTAAIHDVEFANRWKLAGALGGAGAGGLCVVWPYDLTRPDRPLQPTRGCSWWW